MHFDENAHFDVALGVRPTLYMVLALVYMVGLSVSRVIVLMGGKFNAPNQVAKTQPERGR